MIIRLILILTVLALVLGGVGAAFVSAQAADPIPATTTPLPAQTPDPVKTPDPAETPHAKASVTKDARHDDVSSQQEAVEVNSDDDDMQGHDDYSVTSAPSAVSAPSAASTVSAVSTPSAASVPSAASTDD